MRPDFVGGIALAFAIFVAALFVVTLPTCGPNQVMVRGVFMPVCVVSR